VRRRLVTLSLAGLLLLPAVAAAQVYRWVDRQGRVHYSEGLYSVPSEYRAGAKAVEWQKSPPPPPPAQKPEEKPGAPAGTGQPAEPERKNDS
jgi:hypothetical protein